MRMLLWRIWKTNIWNSMPELFPQIMPFMMEFYSIDNVTILVLSQVWRISCFMNFMPHQWLVTRVSKEHWFAYHHVSFGPICVRMSKHTLLLAWFANKLNILHKRQRDSYNHYRYRHRSGKKLLGSNRAFKHDIDKQKTQRITKLQIYHTNPMHALEEI